MIVDAGAGGGGMGSAYGLSKTALISSFPLTEPDLLIETSS